MSEQATCGKGLAQQSRLQAMLGDVVDAVARVLDVHTRALDPAHPEAHRELETYIALVTEHRSVASQLHALARHMESCRDLPMAPHDHAAMASPDAIEAFDRLVTLEHSLADHLARSLPQHDTMLEQMRGAG